MSTVGEKKVVNEQELYYFLLLEVKCLFKPQFV